MPTHHTARVPVRVFDVDAWHEVPTTTLASYLEQAARDASAALGFDQAWYSTQGTAWIIRRLTLARYLPLGDQDAVTVETWISAVRRVRSNRDYVVRDAAGRIAAAGRGEWVYFDLARAAPAAIDRAIVARADPGDGLTLAPPPAALWPAPGPAHTSTRRAFRYEADTMGHVNNAVYLAWLDEALADAVAAAGLPLTPAGSPGLRLRGTWYEVDYLLSALPGDALAIRSRVIGTAEAGMALAWQQEIRRTTTDEVLLRCTSRQELRGLAAAGLDAAAVVRALAGA